MSDEWRVRIEVPADDAREVLRSIEQVAPRDFAGGTEARFPVSHSDEHIFIYADSESEARRAIAELDGVLAEHDLRDDVTLWRWHPIAERWEDPSQPLPETETELEREHAMREALEARRSRETGLAEWEVRVTLPTRDDARALAERLSTEDIPVTRGWRHVMVGAATEDDAHELAQRLRAEAPAGSLLHVEPSGAEAWRITHPFAVFGGLGG
jgi:hypothetical protein